MLLEDKYVDFLIDNNLTQSQYLLLHLVHKKRLDLIRKYKKAFHSDEKGDTMIGEYYTKDLVNRGFLVLDENETHYIIGKKYVEIFIQNDVKLVSDEAHK